jgi:hypothetical protein
MAGLMAGTVMALAIERSLTAQTPPGRNLEILVQTPEPRVFLMALDEIELDWSEATPEQRPASVQATPGVLIVNQQRDRTVMRLEAVHTTAALAERISEQESANPGARGRVVLYEPNRPRSPTTRRLLTSDVAVLLNRGVVIEEVLAQAALPTAQAVAGVTGGYVIRVESPLVAIEVARALAGLPGVRTAYPLLQRTPATR